MDYTYATAAENIEAGDLVVVEINPDTGVTYVRRYFAPEACTPDEHGDCACDL